MLFYRYLLFALVLMSGSLEAHPHVWIDLRVSFELDDRGQVTGLRQAWRFDPFYSLILIEELERGGPSDELEQRFDELALEVVNNLSDFDFFTHIRASGKRQKLASVTEYNLLQIGRRIEFSFLLPFEQPIDPRQHTLRYQVYDPTYYIEILHASDQGIDQQKRLQICNLELKQPNPSSDLIAKALALDEDEVPEDPLLGEHFAETVYLDCQP